MVAFCAKKFPHNAGKSEYKIYIGKGGNIIEIKLVGVV